MPVKPKVPKQTDPGDLPNPKKVVDQGLVEIDFQGATFVIPRDRDDWSTEGNAWLGEGKFNLFVKYLLEIARPGQWKTLTRLCPTPKQFNQFFVVLGKAIQEECIG